MTKNNGNIFAPILSWESLNQRLSQDFSELDWKPHISIIAPTRGGKTTLALRGILPHFQNALILDTTGDPKAPMKNYGEPLKKWGKIEGHKRLTLSSMSSDSKRKVHAALDKAFNQGDVTIYVDEIRQLCDKRFLAMQPAMEHIWLFGAKRGVNVIGATQAPRFVPSAFYDQSHVHFIFKIRDKRSQKRLSEISGDVDTLDAIAPNLDMFQFAYVNPMGDVVRSTYKK